MGKQLSIAIKNERAEIGRVAQAFDRFWRFHNLDEPVVHAVGVALDEMIANIIEHAYDDAKEHIIDIKIRLTETAVVLQIRDDGRPFNPFTQTKPDTTSALTVRPVGGLGLHLATSLMDSYEYQYTGKYNCVLLKKNLEG